MEIEAKFTVPDASVFQRLIQVERLAGHALTPARLKQLHDRYLDTADGGFLRGGYACRVRDDGGGRPLLTLKSLTPAQGALHARQELEARLPAQAGLDVAGWPDCPAASLAVELSRGQPLAVLFDLRQARYQRLATLVEGQEALVELSIDHTRFGAAADSGLLGVEVELLPGGDRASLQAIADELQWTWGLDPQPTSKFEWGLLLAHPELVPLLDAR